MHCLSQRIGLKNLDGWSLYEVNTTTNIEKYVPKYRFIADYLASWEQEARDTSEKDNSIYGTAIRYGTLGTINKANSTKIADLQLSYKFVFKKRLFKNVREIPKDPIEVHLLYAQAVNSVVQKDEYPVSEPIALKLAGLQAQVNLGEFSSKRSIQHYNDVLNYICKRILSKKQPNGQAKPDWASRISEAHNVCTIMYGAELKNSQLLAKLWYLSVVMQYRLYGCTSFYVIHKGYYQLIPGLDRFLLGVNREFIFLVNPQDKRILKEYKYSDIESVSVLSTQMNEENLITFKLSKECVQVQKELRYLTFESLQKEDIAALIYSYAPKLNTSQNGFADRATQNGSTGANRRLLKMTLEDRMKFYNELMNCRKIIVESGILRKPENAQAQESVGFVKSTLRRLNKTKLDKMKQEVNFAADFEADCFTLYPHSFWAISKCTITNSILITADLELQRIALQSFNSILKYSGLLGNLQPLQSQLQHTQNNLDSSQSSPTNSTNSSSTHLTNSPIINGNCNGQLVQRQQSTGSSSSSSPILNSIANELNQIQLAQLIIHRAMHKNASDIFRNEIFLQLIKQTTDHPEPNTVIN